MQDMISKRIYFPKNFQMHNATLHDMVVDANIECYS